MKIHSKNRRAKYDYEFFDKYTAGISLLGTEVKSIKNGDVDLSGSFIYIDKENNAQWLNGNVAKYKFQTQGNHDEKRTRQLLLNKNEIRKIKSEVTLKKMTIIPYLIFSDKKGKIKLEIYLAKGKKNYDKRQDLKERDFKKEVSKYGI